MAQPTGPGSGAPAPAAPATASAADAHARPLCVLFRSGGERLALRASDVYKVVGQAQLCRLPRLPPAFSGISHYRGRIVTVVDAAALLFGAPPDWSTVEGQGIETRLVVLDRLQRHLALGVDAVDEIEPIRLGPDLPEGPVPALKVAQHRGQAVFFLDADRLLELILAQKFLPAGGSV